MTPAADNPEEIAVTLRIQGRVQGVWYRGWMIEQASRRGLRGWVRNRRDGSVEALVVGLAAEVEGMVAECRRGPPSARVTSVTRQPAADPGADGFVGRPTE